MVSILSDLDTLFPTFEVDLPGEYVAQLIVNDGMVDSNPDTVLISTENGRQSANKSATLGVIRVPLVNRVSNRPLLSAERGRLTK